jgi:hypothetical protein
MNTIVRDLASRYHPASVLMIFVLLVAFPFRMNAADSAVQVQLNGTKAGPRAIESLTERAVTRDYRNAWTRLAQALEFSSLDLIEGAFTGDAKRVLTATIISQQKSGLRQRYTDQTHKLEAVFYAPEGDVIELHDTAEYQQQVLDGGKLIQNERVAIHYVVLMTPSADGWVVRYLQTVPQF